MPNYMSENMSGKIPEDIPNRMPEDMPDKMPENISDRISEDLPMIYIYINVIMDIIRKK